MSSISPIKSLSSDLLALVIQMSGNGARAAQVSHLFRRCTQKANALTHDRFIKLEHSPIGVFLKDEELKDQQLLVGKRNRDDSKSEKSLFELKSQRLQAARGDVQGDLEGYDPLMTYRRLPEWEKVKETEAFQQAGFASLSCEAMDRLFKLAAIENIGFDLTFISTYAAARSNEIEGLRELTRQLNEADNPDAKYKVFLDWQESESCQEVFQQLKGEAEANGSLFWIEVAGHGGKLETSETGTAFVCMPGWFLDGLGEVVSEESVALSALGRRDMTRLATLWEEAPDFRPLFFSMAFRQFPKLTATTLMDQVFESDQFEIIPLLVCLVSTARMQPNLLGIARGLLPCIDFKETGPAFFASYCKLITLQIERTRSVEIKIALTAELLQRQSQYPRLGEMPPELFP